MNVTNTDKGNFIENIRQASERLRIRDYDCAYSLIVEAMCADPNAPQPHNLLGILYELSGDGNLARRHYRAAYSLDPTYKPACSNLERICTDFSNKLRSYDYGDTLDETNPNVASKQEKNKRT